MGQAGHYSLWLVYILLSALKLFFPLCLLQFFFHLDPGDSKKVTVFTKLNEPEFTKTQGAE